MLTERAIDCVHVLMSNLVAGNLIAIIHGKPEYRVTKNEVIFSCNKVACWTIYLANFFSVYSNTATRNLNPEASTT